VRALEWRDVDLEGKVIRLGPKISKNKDGKLFTSDGEFLEIVQSAQKEKTASLFLCLSPGRPTYR